MKNFPIIDKETGREYWISRSVAVLAIVTARSKENNREYILAVNRGTGTPDPEYVGCWCLPCGYVDFDETCVEAVQREVLEETGIMIPTLEFHLNSINDIPESDKRQNITFRYTHFSSVSAEDLEKLFTTKNSEKDEVSAIAFIPLDEINNLKWAFNHQNLIKNVLDIKKG